MVDGFAIGKQITAGLFRKLKSLQLFHGIPDASDEVKLGVPECGLKLLW